MEDTNQTPSPSDIKFFDSLLTISCFPYTSSANSNYDYINSIWNPNCYQQEDKSLFKTKVIDLRLRKMQEINAKKAENLRDVVNNRIGKLREESKTSKGCPEEVFDEEPAHRNQIPSYLLNQEKFQFSENQRNSGIREPLNLKKIQKQYSTRLQKSQTKGIKRAKERIKAIEGGL